MRTKSPQRSPVKTRCRTEGSRSLGGNSHCGSGDGTRRRLPSYLPNDSRRRRQFREPQSQVAIRVSGAASLGTLRPRATRIVGSAKQARLDDRTASGVYRWARNATNPGSPPASRTWLLTFHVQTSLSSCCGNLKMTVTTLKSFHFRTEHLLVNLRLPRQNEHRGFCERSRRVWR